MFSILFSLLRILFALVWLSFWIVRDSSFNLGWFVCKLFWLSFVLFITLIILLFLFSSIFFIFSNFLLWCDIIFSNSSSAFDISFFIFSISSNICSSLFFSRILNTSLSSEIIPQERPIVSAVSILSPVIIQKLISASIKSSISLFTLSCNLSSSAVAPNKIEFNSILSITLSNSGFNDLSFVTKYFISSYSFNQVLYSCSSIILKL